MWALLVPVVASADPGDIIRYRLDGTVENIENLLPDGFEIGDPFVVVFDVDTSVADIVPSTTGGVYPASTTLVSASIGTYQLSSTTPAGMSVTNDAVSGGKLREGLTVQWWENTTGDPIDLEFDDQPDRPSPAIPLELSFRIGDNDSDGSLLADDSIPAMALDLSLFDSTEFYLSFNSRDCDPASDDLECNLSANVRGTIDSMTLVPTSDPDADDDADGVANSIDQGDGVFADGNSPTTSGEILDDGGLDVLITDATDPAGVRIVATGSGGPATVQVCGFTISLTPGSDATITCGSVTVATDAGEVTVLLDGGNSVSVPVGAVVRVDQSPGGTVDVVNLGPVAVTVVLGGVTHTVEPGEPASFDDEDDDGVFDVDDLCLGTAPLGSATTPGLKHNRYAVDASGHFVDGDGDDSGYTIFVGAGCDETQIIDAVGLGKGHSKFGLSKGALKNWMAHASS